MGKLLDRVDTPQDIRAFSAEELKTLCTEIREYMVDVCSRNPGHLASSLGAVELITGFHYVFNSPEDKIVFDVGHQAYAHKILTGRKAAFETLRQNGGLSGFPNMAESEYDAFGVGHSSTSISAALGIAEAERLKGSTLKTVAFIGDGALTGGLAYEGLNNAGISKADLLVIVNDNNQSIDRNIGGMHNHLLRLTTNRSYNWLKDQVWDNLGENKVRGFLQRWVRSLKSWIVKKSGGDLFESLGFRYFGPIDGNNIEQVVAVLTKLKGMKGPRVLHCITTKGKGYPQAEADPTVWHAPGKFNPQTGERIKGAHKADRYQDVFGGVLCEIAESNETVVGITPAMASGCGMTEFAEQYPKRFFDVGIEEEHAVTFSAGLAAAGMKPFCNIYSSFSQRAYDQIIHDVALQKLPVVLCFDRAGLVGEDGATHHGVFDIAAYRAIPGAIVSAPSDELELKNLMYTALGCESGPFIIRYPRGEGEGIQWKDIPAKTLTIGKAECLKEGSELAIVATGPLVHRAIEAVEAFNGKVGVFNFRFIKPLDTEVLGEIAQKYSHVVTLEEGCLNGGLYSAVCEYFAQQSIKLDVSGVGIPDEFIAHARQADERRYCGLDTESIKEKIQKVLENQK